MSATSGSAPSSPSRKQITAGLSHAVRTNSGITGRQSALDYGSRASGISAKRPDPWGSDRADHNVLRLRYSSWFVSPVGEPARLAPFGKYDGAGQYLKCVLAILVERGVEEILLNVVLAH